MEVIREIKKRDDDQLGYQITTDQQVIQLLIDNSQDCCEQWGVITTEDNLLDFIGAELLSLAMVDTNYKKHPLTKEWGLYLEEGGAVFIDVETNKGKLQFVLYNEHNGYYGHQVKIVSRQLMHECYV